MLRTQNEFDKFVHGSADQKELISFGPVKQKCTPKVDKPSDQVDQQSLKSLSDRIKARK